eukprot:2140520-Amphidinium_carterae.1
MKARACGRYRKAGLTPMQETNVPSLTDELEAVSGSVWPQFVQAKYRMLEMHESPSKAHLL